ncbi:hypothetical protein CH252_40645 [Rhodococcus sp. 06-1477-1B]|nr:hypothetical protein CH252_40645 [Rhodococcus sp. 06-1477-1B]
MSYETPERGQRPADAISAYENSIRQKNNTVLNRLATRLLDDAVLAEYVARGGMTDGTTFVPSDSGIAPLRHTLCWSNGGWMLWTGKRWESKHEAEAIDALRRKLRAYFAHWTNDDRATADDVKRYSVLLTKTKASNVLFFLRGLLSVDFAKFDADPDVINCQNGLVSLRDGTRRAAEPSDYVTKITSCDYRPDAYHEDWDKALEALPTEVREWMQIRYGQAITGYAVHDDVIPIQHGDGSNGKSAICVGIVKALGSYGVYVPDKVLLANPNEHPADMMTLRGARFALIEETPEGKHLPTKRLKDLAGTPVVRARAMRQDWVEWDASHTLFVNTNFVPTVAETDTGTWRRLALVKFPYKFVHPEDPIMGPNERKGDPGLRERLRDNPDDQWPAILAWLVDGAMAWFAERDVPMPLTVRADTATWREETDVVMAYARDHLIFDPNAKVLTRDLYDGFNLWLESAGKIKLSEATLTARLEAHDLLKNNNVTRVTRSRDKAGLMRRPTAESLLTPEPAQASMWVGVRFKTVHEQ